MIRLNGFVCVGNTTVSSGLPKHVLFGKDVSSGDQQPYMNGSIDGLFLFDELQEAERGRDELATKDYFQGVHIARLQVDIAEKEGDLVELDRGKRSYVCSHLHDATRHPLNFFGPYREGATRQFDSGASVEDTEFTTFEDLKTTLEFAAEATRQSQAPTYAARFNLTYM